MKLKKVTIAVAVIGILSVAGPAWASGPYDVGVDGDTSGTQYDFSAQSGDWTLAVLAYGFIPVYITCEGVALEGTVNTGAGVSGANALTIIASDWTDCDYNGSPVAITPDHAPPWSIDFTGNATSGTSDIVRGTLSGIDLNVDISSPACNFDVTGSVDLLFDEANQEIVVDEDDGSFQVSNPGCSLFSQGDPASFDVTFDTDVFDSNDNVIPGTALTIS
jgi:hypothetical protein